MNTPAIIFALAFFSMMCVATWLGHVALSWRRRAIRAERDAATIDSYHRRPGRVIRAYAREPVPAGIIVGIEEDGMVRVDMGATSTANERVVPLTDEERRRVYAAGGSS